MGCICTIYSLYNQLNKYLQLVAMCCLHNCHNVCKPHHSQQFGAPSCCHNNYQLYQICMSPIQSILQYVISVTVTDINVTRLKMRTRPAKFINILYVSDVFVCHLCHRMSYRWTMAQILKQCNPLDMQCCKILVVKIKSMQ